MKSLRVILYLWFKKRGLKRKTRVMQTLKTTSLFLVHLPRANSIFALPAVRHLKKFFSQAHFWGIGSEEERRFLELTDAFDTLLFYKTEPRLFSSEYKNLALALKKKPGVYLDFNRPGSKELALLSQADLRWGFFAEDSYPFFNLLVKNEVTGDEFDKTSSLIAPLASGNSEKTIPLTISVPKKRNPSGVAKSLGARGRRLIVGEGIASDLARKIEVEFEAAVIDWTALKEPEVLPTLISNCDLFIGRPSVAFEIALALHRPILLLDDTGAPALNFDFLFRAEPDQILNQLSLILTHGKTKREREQIG